MAWSPPARALITGATAGIGRAAAERFARAGIEVGILGDRLPEVEQAVAAIRSSGGQAFPVHVNLLRREEVEGLIDRLEAEGRPLDVLVNNAGIGLQADLLDTREEDLRRLFEVNFFATFMLSRDAFRHMAARRQGHIINVSSASGRRSLPGMAVYASTKAAMHSFSQALRVEARPCGVHVSEILPMSVRTRFFQDATNRASHAYEPGWKVLTPEAVAERIFRLLRHPAPEVYTSTLARLVLGLDALMPQILDAAIGSRRRK
ncbi:MAG: putative oxidoreductase [Armatimonadetes bacterium]|jgi:short-subunit dehydrogenase|nr:putative oxidoreductase [Armatimonadota bacterium]